MNFSNPYPHTIHEVYPHTFLQMIAADVRFTSPHTSDEYWQKFRKFSEEIFKISVTEHPIAPDQYAEFSSEAAETVYSFKNDAALVAIGSKGYKSFGETMPEHFRTIQGFLQNVVPSSKVHTLTLGKKNRFPFHITLEHFEVKEALNYVFKAEHVEDMDHKIEKGELVKVTKEAKVDLSNHANLLLTIGFQVIDHENVHLLLDLQASYAPPEGIDANQLYDLAVELNGIMYDAFKYVVTENIIDILRKSSLQ